MNAFWQAVLEVVDSYGSFFISALMLITTIIVAFSNKKSRILSVKPFLSFNLVFYNRLSVELKNSGPGVAIIDKIKFKKDGIERSSLFEIVSFISKEDRNIEGIEFKRFEPDLKGKAIGPSETVYLLEKEPSQQEKMHPIKYKKEYILLAEILSEITIRVEYSDIYGNKQTPLDMRLLYFKSFIS